MTHWTPVQSAHNRDGTPLQTMPDDETIKALCELQTNVVT